MTNSLKLLSATVGSPVTNNPATGKPPLWKMALDVERCIGCHACSVACKVEHGVPLGRYRTKVYYWEHGKFPQVKRNFLPTLCMQCEDAPCLKACPTDAINRQGDGIVRIDPDKCDHEGKCEAACPYAAIGCDDNDVADKCDFCSNRLSVGMEPACVETCPAEVFYFGDANDAQSPYSRFMARHGNKTAVLKPEEKTKPSVAYKGHTKEMEKKIPKGRIHDPYSYEIETWAQLEAEFPRRKRVMWAKVDPGKNMIEYRANTGGVGSGTAAFDDAAVFTTASLLPTPPDGYTPENGGAA